jgi:hypothetical protein
MALKGAFVSERAPFSTAYLGRDWTMRESKTANFSMSALISYIPIVQFFLLEVGETGGCESRESQIAQKVWAVWKSLGELVCGGGFTAFTAGLM